MGSLPQTHELADRAGARALEPRVPRFLHGQARRRRQRPSPPFALGIRPPCLRLCERAERRLRETIGCSIAVTLKAPGTIPRSEGGKLQRSKKRIHVEVAE